MPELIALRRLPRALTRTKISGRRQSVRHIATAAATAEQPIAPQYVSDAATSFVEPTQPERWQAVREARPFSDFLTDKFNRQHDYLRISVTERCNLRCLYCMPEEGVELSPQAKLLTSPEIFYLSSLFVSQGVTKIRLTGGEPTIRPDIVPLMQQIGSLRSKGLRELALTTNAISLHRKLDKMVEAGLTGINISLDTLDPFQFQIMTRRKGFDAVMKSIDRVLEMNKLGAGVKLKINCVVMRGMNEREIIPFVEMGREKDVEVRFIEYMPFDGNKWAERKMLPYQEMLDIIRTKYPDVRQVRGHANDTSKTYEVPGFVGRLGFITSMTHNFCGSCNRLRITSDGNLKVCLFGNSEVSLRDMLRKDNNGRPIDQEAFEALKEVEMNRHQGLLSDSPTPSWTEREKDLLNVIGVAVKRKKEKHAGIGQLENMKNRPMILIGGILPNSILVEAKQRVILSTNNLLDDVLVAPLRQPSFPTGGGAFNHTVNKWARRPGSQIPLHLLGPPQSAISCHRAYSSDVGDSKQSPKEPAQKSDMTRGDPVQDDTRAGTTTPKSFANSIATGLGFQSLSALFQQPIGGRYSQPRRQRERSEAQTVMNEQTENPEAEPYLEKPQARPAETGSTSQEPSNYQHADAKKSNVNPEESKNLPEAYAKPPPNLDTAQLQPQISESSQRTQSEDSKARPRPVHGKGSPLIRAFRVRDRHKMTSEEAKLHYRSAKKDMSNEPVMSKVEPRKLPTKDPENVPPWMRLRDDTLDASPESSDATDEAYDQAWGLPIHKMPSGLDGSPFDSVESSRQTSRPASEDSKRRASPARSMDPGPVLTHVDQRGEARMVDVGEKANTHRIAIAYGFVRFTNVEAYRLVSENRSKKGDVMGTARVAGIMAAKRCADLIPLCHPIAMSAVRVDVELVLPRSRKSGVFRSGAFGAITVEATVECNGPTGVEMEALTAVAGATLTVYDMCKAVDREMFISQFLVYKDGGKSGKFVHPAWEKNKRREEEKGMDDDDDDAI